MTLSSRAVEERTEGVPRLGIATCRERPELQPDDELMVRQLGSLDILVAPWDDPSAAWSTCDGVLLRSVWDYHLRIDEFLDWLEALAAAGVTVWNPTELVTWNARKSYLGELQAGGVPTVPTVWLEPERAPDWPEQIGGAGWDEVVLKPLVGASSFLTWRSSTREAIERADRLDRLAAHGGGLVQPFVHEVESAGEWSLVYFDGQFSHAVRKRARAGEFRVQIEFGGSEEPAVPPAGVRELADAALAATPVEPLYARVDGIESAAGFLVSELELIEPVLFLASASTAPGAFAGALLDRLRGAGSR